LRGVDLIFLFFGFCFWSHGSKFCTIRELELGHLAAWYQLGPFTGTVGHRKNTFKTLNPEMS